MSSPATAEMTSVPRTPAEIGREMVALRAQFGLTVQEVSERLHIRTRYIAAMEEGRYELMPGKVYARGYVHTYAEFLGMDTEKTVEECFAGEPVPHAQPVPPPATTRATLHARRVPYKRMVAALAVAALVAFGVSRGRDDAPPPASEPMVETVAPVPESMLASVRTLIMPTAANYPCLMVESALNCFYHDAASRRLSQLTRSNRLSYVGEIDVSGFMTTPETDEETPAATAPAAAPEEALPEESRND